MNRGPQRYRSFSRLIRLVTGLAAVSAFGEVFIAELSPLKPIPQQWPCRLQANDDPQKRGRNGSAIVCALVLSFREIVELLVELLDPSILPRCFERIHRWAVKPSKRVD